MPDKGQDKVFLFRLDTATSKLIASASVNARNNAGPRHAGFHPTKPYAYVTVERDTDAKTLPSLPYRGEILRFTTNDGGKTFDPASEKLILRVTSIASFLE